MSQQPYISLKKASLGYKKRSGNALVLTLPGLDFFAGDFVGIAGLNGIGKSTLLKSISGLLPVLSGDIFIEGKEPGGLSLAELSKKIALVLTEKIGGFNLTAYDVVAAGQMPYTNAFHQLKPENISVIESAIAACGLAGHAHKPVGELSDGLFQKTIIAKALAQQTPAMLLDEPSAFLDYASKHALFILLKQLAAENKCILVSSHDLDLMLKYCNKILVVADGGAQLMPVAEAQQNEAFKKIGGGFI